MMSVWDMSNKLTLVIALIAVVTVMTAVVSTEQVMAKKHKDKETGGSAMERGAADATCGQDNDCDHLYITQPGKGFGDHSKEFNHNYIKGRCAAAHNKFSSDADEATFDCPN
jgi:nitrate reductase cytochrome c-type subunit